MNAKLLILALRRAMRRNDQMKKTILLVLAMLLTPGVASVFGGGKSESESVTVYGWLAEIDPTAHTFAIRNGKKLLQFTTIPKRTNITVGTWEDLQTSLSSARVGDAVIVELATNNGRLWVESAKFSHRPATATPLKSRPGFILSPYSHTVFDARKCKSGEMLEDFWPGQIFLVP